MAKGNILEVNTNNIFIFSNKNIKTDEDLNVITTALEGDIKSKFKTVAIKKTLYVIHCFKYYGVHWQIYINIVYKKFDDFNYYIDLVLELDSDEILSDYDNIEDCIKDTIEHTEVNKGLLIANKQRINDKFTIELTNFISKLETVFKAYCDEYAVFCEFDNGEVIYNKKGENPLDTF